MTVLLLLLFLCSFGLRDLQNVNKCHQLDHLQSDASFSDFDQSNRPPATQLTKIILLSNFDVNLAFFQALKQKHG